MGRMWHVTSSVKPTCGVRWIPGRRWTPGGTQERSEGNIQCLASIRLGWPRGGSSNSLNEAARAHAEIERSRLRTRFILDFAPR
jgi:hypothetical protein